jgi:hypothetical protein
MITGNTEKYVKRVMDVITEDKNVRIFSELARFLDRIFCWGVFC